MEHSSWPKMGFQLLKLSLLVNRKGTSEMGSESGENIFMLMGSDECPGQLFRGKDKKFRRRSCPVWQASILLIIRRRNVPIHSCQYSGFHAWNIDDPHCVLLYFSAQF